MENKENNVNAWEKVMQEYSRTGDPAPLANLYSVERETVDRYDSMVASLNLTAKQAQILTLKQSGYGNKAIATYMGISENSVKGACTEIRRKAAARFPAELLEKYVK